MEGSNHLKVRADNPFGSDQESRTILYEPERPPAVKIVDPPKGVTVQNEKYTVEAKLFRVDAASDVTLTHDGKGISQFQFDPKSGKLQAPLKLSGGTNKIVVEGENDLGSDKDEVQIEYEQQTSPKVDITYPGTSPFQFGQSSIQVKGNATGIQDESELELIANGQEVGSFQFHNGHFKYEMSLDPGQNEFVAKVQTSAGQDEDEVLIHYSSVSSYRGGGTGTGGKSSKKESSGQSSQEGPSKTEKESSKKSSEKDDPEEPEVSLTKPTSSSTTVEGVQMEGTVENADEVELSVNGKKLSFERSGNKIEAEVPLQKGENTILLKGSNPSGSDSDQHTIEYEPMKEEGQIQKGGTKEPDEGPEPSSKEKKKQERKEQKKEEKELKKKEKKEKEGGESSAPKKKK